MAYIKGNFRKYIFKSDKGYVIGLFKVREASSDVISYVNSTITFTGYFHDLNENDLYTFSGDIVNHERYGEQFNVSSYEIVLPNDKDNIIEFLSSNLFPGIGEKKASIIVDYLGPDCLEKILSNPDEMSLVPGLTKKQQKIIYDNLLKYQYSFEIIVSLTKFGFNTRDALSIYNKYKNETLSVLEFNPYLLVDDLNDISFKKIDNVRGKFNILDDDERRIKACIKHVMEELSNSLGSTYFNKEEIFSYMKRSVFSVTYDVFLLNLDSLILNNDIILVDNRLTLYKMYEAEQYIASRIFELSNNMIKTKLKDKDLIALEKFFDIKYSDQQTLAIRKSIENNLLVITGGPGTGKTTIIKAICRLYQEVFSVSGKDIVSDIALIAPTGRAAKRISEEAMLPASTIHRFLKWNKEDNTFRVNEEERSSAKLVIIDEASMIDTYLFYNLLLGLEYNTKIIIIGDYNQLPSVGSGQILKDIIESDCIDIIKLDRLYRTDKDSNINTLAYNILDNNYDMDVFNSMDLEFIPCNTSDLKSKLLPIINNYKSNLDNFQILIPIYKGDNGIDDINIYAQDLINPLENRVELNVESEIFRVGDKVLQLTNVPDLNVYNGDIGYITNIMIGSKKEIHINFDYNSVVYTQGEFSNIRLGYAISIHKAQGSEFDTVILPILSKYSGMLYKKLIYTAVTRTKKKLIVLGEESAFKKAILNDKESSRNTNLKNFITSCIK